MNLLSASWASMLAALVSNWPAILISKKHMAKNGQPGNGRIGAVRGRSQTFNPTTQQWVKRDTSTGRFMDVKQNGDPFKGVRKER